jgi:hypothetical protein
MIQSKNIQVEIIAGSINPSDKKITTFLVKYPRMIHAEIMTHRVFSRNAASSRAIPIGIMMDKVATETAYPERWGTNGKGMQDHGDHDNPELCQMTWDVAAANAIKMAKNFDHLGLHKQIANRVLEPFGHITTLITSTEWNNFFQQRAHPDAEPSFQVLAYRMLDAYLNFKHERLKWNEWHIPFVDMQKHQGLLTDAIEISVASCARTSYLKQSEIFELQQQKNLFQRLLNGRHPSPFEHQAQAIGDAYTSENFRGGWLQNRSLYSELKPKAISLESIMSEKPAWISV